jgi:hypothetical protein
VKRRAKRVRLATEPDLTPYRRRNGSKGCLQNIVKCGKRSRRLFYYMLELECGHCQRRELGSYIGSRADCRECKP